MMEKRVAQNAGEKMVFLCAAFAFLLILCFPSVAGAGVRTGLTLCYQAVIPSVFPSIVLTDLLFSRPTDAIEDTVGRIFARVYRVSPRGVIAWIAGLLCGFPLGAVTVASDVRRGLLSREEGEYLLSFVNNTGPAFLVGGVGAGLFGSAKIGWTLYLMQIPISLLVGFLFRPKENLLNSIGMTNQFDTKASPVDSIMRGAEGCVRIVGFVCFFSVLSSLFSLFLPDGLPLALASCVLEVGTGAARAAALDSPFPALPLTAFAVCFSGVSVCFQTLAATDGTGMRPTLYVKGKIASGLAGILLCTFFCLTNSPPI